MQNGAFNIYKGYWEGINVGLCYCCHFWQPIFHCIPNGVSWKARRLCQIEENLLSPVFAQITNKNYAVWPEILQLMENCCSQGQEKTAKLKTDCYYLNIELDRKTRWFWLCSKHSVYCFHCNSGQQLDNSKQPLHSRISHNNKYQHIKKCIQKQKQTHMDVTKYVKLHQHLTKYTPTMLCIPRSPSISSQVDFSALFGNSEITDFNNSSMCNTAVILPLPTQKHVIHDI